MAGENRLDQLIDAWEPRLRQAFLSAIAQMRDRAQITGVVVMLERGDVDGAIRSVGLDPAAFRLLDSAIAQAFEAAGNFTMGQIPATKQPDGSRLNILFDVRNQRAEGWLRDHSSTLVTQIVDDQRAMLRQHLVAGMEAGRNPTDVARDIVGRINPTTRTRQGGVLGLTSAQEGWARNYAARLASGDPAALGDALTMKLRDKRFDRTVQKAIREETPLAADVRARMVESYRNRALKHRGDVIGRTEAMASLHAAQDEAFQQAVDVGQVQASTVKKVWHSAGDFRVRHTHRALNGQRVGFHAAFVSPSGATLRYPGDPTAPAAETVSCRCWMETRIDHVAVLKQRLAA